VLERELLLAGVEDVPEVLDPHRRRSPEPEPELEKKKKTGSLTGSRNCGPAVRCGRVSNFLFFFFLFFSGWRWRWRNHSQTRLQSNTLFTC
jgi:hypothetical protein